MQAQIQEIKPLKTHVFSFDYEVVRTHVDAVECVARCEKRVKVNSLEPPSWAEEYKVLRTAEIGEGVDRGLGYYHNTWDYPILVEKGGERYVAVLRGGDGWTTYSNAIECSNPPLGTILVLACETGHGYIEARLELYRLEDYGVEDIEEYFEYDAEGVTLADVIREFFNDMLKRLEEN